MTGFTDHLLLIESLPTGVVEAKPVDTTLSDGDRQAVAEFPTEGSCGRDDRARPVAQMLAISCSTIVLERWLLEGFLVGRGVLPDAEAGTIALKPNRERQRPGLCE